MRLKTEITRHWRGIEEPASKMMRQYIKGGQSVFSQGTRFGASDQVDMTTLTASLDCGEIDSMTTPRLQGRCLWKKAVGDRIRLQGLHRLRHGVAERARTLEPCESVTSFKRARLAALERRSACGGWTALPDDDGQLDMEKKLRQKEKERKKKKFI